MSTWTVRGVWRNGSAEAGTGIPAFLAAAAGLAAMGRFNRAPSSTVLTGPVSNGDFGQGLGDGDITVSVTFNPKSGATPSAIRGARFGARSIIVRDTSAAGSSPTAGQLLVGGIASDPVGFAGDVVSGAGTTGRGIADAARGAVETVTDGASTVLESLGTTKILLGAVAVIGLYIYLRKTGALK